MECNHYVERVGNNCRATDVVSITHMSNYFSSSPRPSWVDIVRNSISTSAEPSCMNSILEHSKEGETQLFYNDEDMLGDEVMNG